MNPLLYGLLKRARSNPRSIVLPEAMADIRVRQAAEILVREGLARPILLGHEEELTRDWEYWPQVRHGIEIVDHRSEVQLCKFITLYQSMRAKEGLSNDAVRDLFLADPVLAGAALVALGEADGMTAGACTATASVIRAGIKLVGLRQGIRTVSSFFLMVLPDRSTLGDDVFLVFADCGVVPEPNSEQLADIAESTAAEVSHLLPGFEPSIAMLSFSTRGSAQHPSVDKVREGTAILRQRRPDWVVDGELQADAALVPEVRRLKAPDSPIRGTANILIFPDLDSGNIGYKLVQRLTGADALGPFLSGLRLPINDLSRGASPEEVAYVAAITGLQRLDQGNT